MRGLFFVCVGLGLLGCGGDDEGSRETGAEDTTDSGEDTAAEVDDGIVAGGGAGCATGLTPWPFLLVSFGLVAWSRRRRGPAARFE